MLLHAHTSRGLGRPKSVLFAALIVVLVYYLLIKAQEYRAVRLSTVIISTGTGHGGKDGNRPQPKLQVNTESNKRPTPLPVIPNSDPIPPTTAVSEPEGAGTNSISSPEADSSTEGNREQQAQIVQAQYENEYKTMSDASGAGLIYGSTLAKLKAKDSRRPHQEDNLVLFKNENDRSFGGELPYSFNPYPNHKSKEWKSLHGEHVACPGPGDAAMGNIRVFKGHPEDFPKPGFGSYDILGIDENICYERETRLGQYGLTWGIGNGKESVDWDSVDWGDLQTRCVDRNMKRFRSHHSANTLAVTGLDVQPVANPVEGKSDSGDMPTAQPAGSKGTPGHDPRSDSKSEGPGNITSPSKEPRIAVLLRSYTGKTYTENDKQVIRSLVTELNLRTGGEYQVFLLVHVKQPTDIWGDSHAYQYVVQSEIPREFWGMTVLWNDDAVRRMYPRLEEKAAQVHNAQYLSVQKFMQEHREFDFVWNWEMDSRVIGHHYDLVSKLAEFSKKQPRRGLWERNERFYIRNVHGDYDTEFRKAVELVYGNDTIWGPPDGASVQPRGPKPPVPTAQEDDYQWGVGEEADLITLSPMFNPLNSNWILRDQVWGYQAAKDLPRRATIITQCRLSRQLTDLMHAENLAGRHVGSEMMPQTVSLLHGLKAVYAPMPVFFDRPWTGVQLARWFNGGSRGESGGLGSAMGWGRESRFQGSTWYFRADPPQRLYNNWMGYEDTGVGGAEWEETNGRSCLPAMMLHPVKDVRPTEKGSSSKSNLPYR